MSSTVGALLTDCTQQLAHIGADARAEASRIIAAGTGMSRAAVFAYHDLVLSDDVVGRVCEYAARRAMGEPLAYILGEAWFYGHRFIVNADVLIPRPETEHLLDEILQRAPTAKRICDIGTGSGAIAISLSLALPHADITAIDISPDALAIAGANSVALDCAARVHFLESDLLAALTSEGTAPFDVIVANLPYIPRLDVPQKPDPVGFEPIVALDGGPQGVEIYERLVRQLPPFLADHAVLLFEAAPPTLSLVEILMRRYLPPAQISAHRDYAGLARYCVWQR